MANLHESIAADDYWTDSQKIPRMPFLPFLENLINNSISVVGIGNSPDKRVKGLFRRATEEGYDYRQAESGQELGSLVDDEALIRVVEDKRIEFNRLGKLIFAGSTETDPRLFEGVGIEMLGKVLYDGKKVGRRVDQTNSMPYSVERQVSYLVGTSFGGLVSGLASYELHRPGNLIAGVNLPSKVKVGTPYDRSRGQNKDNLRVVKAGVIIPTPKNKFRIGKLIRQDI